ncbi:hypothetical protein H4R19_001673 [Coemansia spiralis]|nr:hypothetical protein H4R19_001673 [Coemansia spiralis]
MSTAGGPADVYASDRDARRRARHRGNPERARFHRRPDADEFVIHADSNAQVRAESLALVTGLRRISLGEATTARQLDADLELGAAAVVCAPEDTVSDQPEHQASHEASSDDKAPGLDEASSDDKAPDIDEASSDNNAPDADETSSDDERSGVSRSPSAAAPAQESVRSSRPSVRAAGADAKTKRVTQRARESIVADGIEQSLPGRMTRSMARQLGVTAPKRYFGEGVSSSQILRPSQDHLPR